MRGNKLICRCGKVFKEWDVMRRHIIECKVGTLKKFRTKPGGEE